MSETQPEGARWRVEKAADLLKFKEAIKNVLTSSPEVLNEFANHLESEIYSLDTDTSKDAARKTVEVIRETAKTLQSQEQG